MFHKGADLKVSISQSIVHLSNVMYILCYGV